MASSALTVPFSDSSDADSSLYWSYTITIGGNTSEEPVFISGVTDGDGNPTDNLTSTSTGSWGWDENFEYGPFGSYYAAFNESGQLMYHIRADDLNTRVGSDKGTNDVDKSFSIMWVLPTVYWKTTDTALTLTNDSSAGGTAYAHTIDGRIYKNLAIAVYETKIEGDKSRSLSDVLPNNLTTVRTFLNASEYMIDSNGPADGGTGYSMVWNYYQWALYKYCVFATLGTFDSQSFAPGPTTNTDVSITGLANTSDSQMPAGYYADSSSSTDSVRLFLENAWGSLDENISGIYEYKFGIYANQSKNSSVEIDKPKIADALYYHGYPDTISIGNENWGLATSKQSYITGLCDITYPGFTRNTNNDYRAVIYVGGGYNANTDAGVSSFRVGGNESNNAKISGSRISFVFNDLPVLTSRHTVTYNANGGHINSSNVKVDGGGTVILPSPTREFWTFTGWYDGDTKVGVAGDEITVTADRTLTAHWTMQMVNLTLHCNYPGSADDEIYHTTEIPINTAPSDITTYAPAYEGYNFLGWYNESDALTPFDPSEVMTADKDAYAKWAKALVLTSQPTVRLISENTYGLSIGLGENQTATWFDTYGNIIGTGAAIEYTFTEPGTHVGTVKVADSADSTVYAVTEWSAESAAEGSTGENTEENGMNIPLIIGIAIPAAAIGFFLIRRL